MDRAQIVIWMALAIALGLLGGATPARGQQAALQSVYTPAASSTDFKITLLGTSTPNPRADRFGPSTLVEAGAEKLVFDCGRGCTIRLWQLKIPLGTVKLFITHLHSDHTVGIPDLWLTGFAPLPYGRRNTPFEVWGPRGTAEMMSYLEKAYEADIENRREFHSQLRCAKGRGRGQRHRGRHCV